jgi:hypothetical protein
MATSGKGAIALSQKRLASSMAAAAPSTAKQQVLCKLQPGRHELLYV